MSAELEVVLVGSGLKLHARVVGHKLPCCGQRGWAHKTDLPVPVAMTRKDACKWCGDGWKRAQERSES